MVELCDITMMFKTFMRSLGKRGKKLKDDI